MDLPTSATDVLTKSNKIISREEGEKTGNISRDLGIFCKDDLLEMFRKGTGFC
jgi:hypothetical protein